MVQPRKTNEDMRTGFRSVSTNHAVLSNHAVSSINAVFSNHVNSLTRLRSLKVEGFQLMSQSLQIDHAYG
jgi:hypothetical protein